MVRYKRIVKKTVAVICAAAIVVSQIPNFVQNIDAATLAFDDERSTIMLDAGGFKTQVYGVATEDWGVTYVDRNQTLPPSKTYLTDNYRETVGTVPTSDWASSVVFDKYSEALYAHPLAYRAASNGMQMASPAVVDDISYVDSEPLVESLLEADTVELVVGGEGFTAKDASVDVTTDWSYEIVMENNMGNGSMRATIAKGTPYAYYTFDNIRPTISLGAGATNLAIYKNSTSSNVIGVSLTNKKDGKTHYYIISAAKGTTWTNAGGKLTANLPSGGNYISVGILPNGTDAAFELYEQYAFNFITNTVVEWEYLENASKVATRYNVETTNMETGAVGGDTIIALYPHQWRYADETYTGYTYDTIRGTMKTIVGSSYITQMTYNGILSTLPVTTDENTIGTIKDQLGYLYDYRKNKGDPKWIAFLEGQYGGYDTYWVGKNLNTLTEAILLADQFEDADMQKMADDMVEGMANYMEFWFDPFQSYQSGQFVDDYFYYHEDYGTLIGYPTSYGSDYEVNDHHFHYGYWIRAAATIAMKNPEWAKEWGGMVYEMISDIANANRDGSSYNANSPAKYPFLRNFDIYEGHSWASGVANYEYDENGNMIDTKGGLSGGNNQESSSEAINAWVSLIMWGEAVGNDQIRDLGIYMYTTEVAAIEDYYYDVHNEIFTDKYEDSDNFNIQTVTRLFGGRYDHTAWWTENSIEVTTITMLPITGASLYLGKHKEKVKNVVDSISETSKQWTYFVAHKNESCANFGKTDMLVDPETNQDVIAEFYALYDANAALGMYDISDNGKVENGESRAHTLAFITSLKEYGTQNFDITGSSPFSLVLEKDGVKTYIAENHGDEDKTVYFSDGAYIVVPANSTYQGAKAGDAENPNIDDGEIVGSKQKFTLETYLEKLDGTGYDMSSRTVSVKSDSDIYTYEPREMAGFTYDSANINNVLTVNVAEGNLETVKVYYSRNTYKVSYILDRSENAKDNPTQYRYGQTIELKAPTKAGYIFQGWYTDAGYANYIEGINASTSGDLKLYAKFIDKGLVTTYTVEHYLQSENGTFELISEDTKIIEAYVGDAVVAEPNEYEGYSLNENSVTWGIVLAKGELVLRLFYTVGGSTGGTGTADFEGRGALIDENNHLILYVADSADKSYILTYYKICNDKATAENEYERAVASNGSNVPGYMIREKVDGVFSYDAGAITEGQYVVFRFNIADREITEWQMLSIAEIRAAQAAKTEVDYKVHYYKQNSTLDGYEEVTDDLQTLRARVSQVVVTPIQFYDGFGVNSELSDLSGVVTEDGSLELNVYYDRNEYPILYKNTEGVINQNPDTFTYGVNVPLQDLSLAGKQFSGWYSDEGLTNKIWQVSANIADAITVYAGWTTDAENIDIEINGCQISYTAKGMRTIYSVESEINGKKVIRRGLVYALAEYTTDSEIYVRDDSKYVKSFAATQSGKLENGFSDSQTATSYAMTMKFAVGNKAEFTDRLRVRAYAQLEDGTYVYSDIVNYSIYDIADVLYQKNKMNTFAAHNYLYTDILKVVNKDYVEVEYDFSNTLYK